MPTLDQSDDRVRQASSYKDAGPQAFKWQTRSGQWLGYSQGANIEPEHEHGPWDIFCIRVSDPVVDHDRRNPRRKHKRRKGFPGDRKLSFRKPAFDPDAPLAEPDHRNAYVCPNCSAVFVTIDRHKGVTPHGIGCVWLHGLLGKKTDCPGRAISCMYEIEQAEEAAGKKLIPALEWYAPNPETTAGKRHREGCGDRWRETLAIRAIK